MPDSTDPVARARARRRRASSDLLVLLFLAVVSFVVLHRTEAFERFAAWSRGNESWQADEILVALAVSALFLALFSWRRWQDLAAEVARREAAERARDRLEGLLPICAACKRIRDGGDSWVAVEDFVAARSAAEFTHGICPDCQRRLYPELTP